MARDLFKAVIEFPDGRKSTIYVYVDPEGDPSQAMSTAALDLLQDVQLTVFSSGYVEGPSGDGRIAEVVEV